MSESNDKKLTPQETIALAAAPVKPTTCGYCQAKLADKAKFCFNCGEAVDTHAADGWGPGSPVKRVCRIPEERNGGGEVIVPVINGERLLPGTEMPLTFESFDSIKCLIRAHKRGDWASRNGDPDAPLINGIRTINKNLGTISGRQRQPIR